MKQEFLKFIHMWKSWANPRQLVKSYLCNPDCERLLQQERGKKGGEGKKMLEEVQHFK